MSIWELILGDRTIAVITWLGTVGGAIGLYVTFKQARDARSAAIAAKEAVMRLEGRVSIGALAYSYSQLDIVKDLIHSGDIRSAQIVFNPLKRAILEFCRGTAVGAQLEGQIRITRRNVTLIENHLNLGIQDSKNMDTTKIFNALGGIGTFLIDREQQFKYPREVLDNGS